MEQTNVESGETGHVLGNTAEVQFSSFGGRTSSGKVDTGATTSSLHATNITVNGQQVTFESDVLSPNRITLDLAGHQEVHSADGGGNMRPIVSLDVTIDGTPIPNAAFNLNDRSNMDSPILIGQNILQAGKFVVDPSKDVDSGDNAAPLSQRNESAVLQAIETLVENDVSLSDIVKYLQIAAINRITDKHE